MSEWKGFINIRLRDNHKKEIKKRAEKTTAAELTQWLEAIQDDGYKVSLSRDYENDAFVVAMTGKEGTPNDGYCMTQRHRELIVAMCAVRYAHEELAQRGEWENAVEENDWDNW